MPVRLVIQRCASASLLIDNKEAYVHAKAGIIVFVCFLQKTTKEEFPKAIAAVLNSNKFGPSEGVTIATSTVAYDVMIVPQASLAGKLKGKEIQYHGLIEKQTGAQLYADFVTEFRTQIAALNTAAAATNTATAAADSKTAAASEHASAAAAPSAAAATPAASEASNVRFRVFAGTYGNRQAMTVTNDGPLTHVLDF